LFNFFSNL